MFFQRSYRRSWCSNIRTRDAHDSSGIGTIVFAGIRQPAGGVQRARQLGVLVQGQVVELKMDRNFQLDQAAFDKPYFQSRPLDEKRF